jgi:hypothetical protein
MNNETKQMLFLYDLKRSISSVFDFLDSNKNFFYKYSLNQNLIRKGLELELKTLLNILSSILKIFPELPLSGSRFIVRLNNIHNVCHTEEQMWFEIANDLLKLKKEVDFLLSQQ